jgi:flagellar protein FliO/FliZ
LGGEELKIPILALFLLCLGFFFQISLIYAQDDSFQGLFSEEIPIEQIIHPAEDLLRTAEQAFTFGDESAATGAEEYNPSIWPVIRMILTLALAALAVYGVVFLIKKASKRTETQDPFLRILASAHLGSNRYAHVAAVGTQAWLLGSSDGGVNLIGEINDKDILNAMLLEDSRKTAETPTGRLPDFLSMLRRMGTPAGYEAPDAGNIRKRRERLKGL